MVLDKARVSPQPVYPVSTNALFSLTNKETKPHRKSELWKEDQPWSLGGMQETRSHLINLMVWTNMLSLTAPHHFVLAASWTKGLLIKFNHTWWDSHDATTWSLHTIVKENPRPGSFWLQEITKRLGLRLFDFFKHMEWVSAKTKNINASALLNL